MMSSAAWPSVARAVAAGRRPAPHISAARLAALRTLAAAPARLAPPATRAAASGSGEDAASSAAADGAQAAAAAAAGQGATGALAGAPPPPPRLRQEVGLLAALDVEYTHLAPAAGGRHISLPAEVCVVDATGRVLLYEHCNPLGECTPAWPAGRRARLVSGSVGAWLASDGGRRQPGGGRAAIDGRKPVPAPHPSRGPAGAAALAPRGRRAAAALGAGAAAGRGARRAGGAAGGAHPGGPPPAQGLEGAGAGAPARGHARHPAVPVRCWGEVVAMQHTHNAGRGSLRWQPSCPSPN